MRIGFDVAQTCVERAGCGWYADALSRALVALAPENEYHLYHRFGDWIHTNPKTGTQINHTSVQMPFLETSAEDAQSHWDALKNDGANLPGNPHVVQSNSFQAPGVGNAKLIVVIYDVSFWTYPEFATEANRLACQKGILDALSRADGFLFISKASLSEFESVLPGWLKSNGKPAAVVPLASRFGVLTWDKPVLDTNTYWLAVGTLEPRKNYQTLLAGFKLYWERSCRRIPLRVAGGGGWKSESIKADLHRMEAAGMVKWLGYIRESELAALYRSAYALVFPSWCEGFGLPVLEAMGMGCPVICSDRTSLPEIAGTAASYIQPDNPESICEAMLHLETDSAYRNHLIHCGTERAATFSWERTARETLDFYRKVM